MVKMSSKMAKPKRKRDKPAPPPAPDVAAPRMLRIIPPAALLLMAAVAYYPAYFAGFVWDDVIFLDAPQVASFSGLWDIWFNPADGVREGHYWPVVYTSFWLDHKLWGFNPAGFHTVNVLLHGVVSVLLWRLLARLAVPGAWLAAAVFALHPTHVEAVAWTIARKDLLASLFYLLAASYWLRYDEHSQTGDYLKMLALFAAGMLSKSFVITLPAAILIWAWWKRGRADGRDFKRVAPLFLTGMVIAAYDISFFNSRVVIEFDYPLAERLVIAAKSLWFYPAKLLWPDPLPVIYPKWDTSPASPLNWLPATAAIALTAVLWRARRRIGRGPLAAALFFAVTVSPMLGLAVNSYMLYAFTADRYAYLASAGLIAVLTAAAVLAYKRLPPAAGRAAQTLAVLLLACYGVLTWQQTQVFRNDISLFTHIISVNPAAHSAHYNLGKALMDARRLEEAEAAYKTEVAGDAADPKYLQAVNYLASLHFKAKRYEKARELYQYSIGINPEDAESRQNLGSALAQLGRYREAISEFERALAIDPQLHEARANLKLARQKLDESR